MIIKLSPYSPLPTSNDSLTVIKNGEILTINGVELDFSVIPDGATLPAEAVSSAYVLDKVERISSELHLTLKFPIEDSASQAACFPDDIINPPEGLLELPQ